ncbi:11081_t:CDS:2 [Acaulospora colombiana]|uniref:11081_t:CDS:1 n=1 Tax=Acaulospora colombiana TaxID=27376 RepID=A0ACA9K2J6_9GLOM|nr:11081_t:CDS:2 [Acaulospora colombiana]
MNKRNQVPAAGQDLNQVGNGRKSPTEMHKKQLQRPFPIEDILLQ